MQSSQTLWEERRRRGKQDGWLSSSVPTETQPQLFFIPDEQVGEGGKDAGEDPGQARKMLTYKKSQSGLRPVLHQASKTW